jgi:cell division protein FtsB
VLNVLKHNKYNDLNILWLVTGEGEMLSSNTPNEEIEELNKKIEKLEAKNRDLTEEIGALKYEIKSLKSTKKTSKN